jgi:hypothetical protein
MSSDNRFDKLHLWPSLCDGRSSAGTRAIVSCTLVWADVSSALGEGGWDGGGVAAIADGSASFRGGRLVLGGENSEGSDGFFSSNNFLEMDI